METQTISTLQQVCHKETHKPHTCLSAAQTTYVERRKRLQAGKRKKQNILPAQRITDADYADDIALLANTPALAETLLYNLERAAAGIDLHINADKTEYICFNQRGHISTLKGGPLKLVDEFSYRARHKHATS